MKRASFCFEAACKIHNFPKGRLPAELWSPVLHHAFGQVMSSTSIKICSGLVKPSGKPWLMRIEIWVAGVLSGVPMKQGKCHEDRKYLICRKLVSSWQIHQAVASVMKTGVFSVSITQPVWFTVNHSCCGSSFSAAATADTETGRWQEMYFRCFSVIWIPEMQSQALLWTKFKDSCTSYWWLLLKEYFY